MTPRNRSAIAWGAASLGVGLTLLGLGLMAVNWPRALTTPEWGFPGFQALAATVLSLVGLAIVLRRPSNPIGWFQLVSGFFAAVQFVGHQYAIYGLETAPGSVPAPSVGTWFEEWVWVPLFAAMTVFTFLLFPTGRLLSPRWRVVAWTGLAGTALGWIATSFAPTYRVPGAVNPLAPDGPPAFVDPLTIVGIALLMGSAVVASTSLIVRFRRAVGTERQQLKWLALAALLMGGSVVVYLATSVITGSTENPTSVLMAIGILTVPVSIALAMLRYGLYDVDRLINRTVVYGSVSVLLLALYAGSVLIFQASLTWLHDADTLAVAGSTLLVAAIFQPVRRRVQAAVDRRFNRARYDAERTVQAFAGRLRDELDLDGLSRALATTAVDAIQPRSVTVWLRPR